MIVGVSIGAAISIVIIFIMRKKFLTIFAVFCFGFSAMAQTEIQDGKSLIEAYLSPLGNSLGAALNNGWYNTAKPHHLGGFDVTITANLVLVPADAKTFNISESNGSTFSGTGDGNTPTILGDKSGGTATFNGTDFIILSIIFFMLNLLK